MTFRGQFKNGVVVFSQPPPLTEGSTVEVALVQEPEGASAATAPLEEHDTVRVHKAIEVEGHQLHRGMIGAIVSVYGDGEAFAVEFTDLPGGPDVVTLSADQIERAESKNVR